jgi:hypothetical protein
MIQNLIHYCNKMLKIIAIIIAIFFVYFVVINWSDEELKPEVKQALAWQPPADAFDDNGFLVLWGIEAPIELNAAEVGKKTLKAELARFTTMQKTHKEPPPFDENPAEIDDFIDWKDNRCDYQKQQNCVDFYLQQGADKLALVLLVQERLTARFEVIKQSKNYVEVIPPMVAAGFPKYSLLIHASELERIRAISNIAENRMDIGLQGIVNNALFSRRLLEKSNSLVSHMIAVAMMQRDTRILSELMTKYPNIATQYSEQLAPILAPISESKYSLKKTFVNERDWGLAVLSNSPDMFDDEFLTSYLTRSEYFFRKLGYQPNATLNLLYMWGQYRVKLTEVGAVNLAQTLKDVTDKQKALLGLGIHPFYIKNTAGKILVSVAEPDFTNYIERQHDLDGYLKMVKTQLDVMADGVAKDKIVAIEIHDPYTQKLMPFDVKTGVVTFTGRQPSSANFNKSNNYQVKIY